MPVETQYSEGQFAAYLTSVLDTLADVLGWDSFDPRVREAITDALLEYGESNIGSITGASNILKLRALGRRAIWRAVAASTAGNYAIADGSGQKLSREQVHDHAIKMLDLADYECRALGVDVTWSADIRIVSRPTDPYLVLPDEERVA